MQNDTNTKPNKIQGFFTRGKSFLINNITAFFALGVVSIPVSLSLNSCAQNIRAAGAEQEIARMTVENVPASFVYATAKKVDSIGWCRSFPFVFTARRALPDNTTEEKFVNSFDAMTTDQRAALYRHMARALEQESLFTRLNKNSSNSVTVGR